MIITPAILAKDEQSFRHYLQYAHQLPSGRWHVDILDGSLYDTHCWHDATTVGSVHDLPEIELHLMVRDPLPHILAWHRHVSSLCRVLLDADMPHLEKMLRHIHALRLDASLVLNPATSPDVCAQFVADIDEVVVMGVSPGASGQAFLGEEVIAKIQRLRALFPSLAVAVDGGVHLENVSSLARAGVTRIVAASALWKSHSPLDAHLALQEASKIVL